MIADARLPRVLKLPLPFTHRERLAVALAALAERRDPVTRPVRVRTVTPVLAGWVMWNAPPQASRLSSVPPALRSTVTLTTPSTASTTVPFGTTIGLPSNVDLPPGGRKRTVPFTREISSVWPTFGCGAALRPPSTRVSG